MGEYPAKPCAAQKLEGGSGWQPKVTVKTEEQRSLMGAPELPLFSGKKKAKKG
jgi:hypothetical protein